jgi:DNA-binding NarL/FixJ family response regulator
MQLVAEGLSNSEIAKQRFVSEKAIEKTIKLIAEQLQLAPDSSKNLRVSITRAYLKLTGGKA